MVKQSTKLLAFLILGIALIVTTERMYSPVFQQCIDKRESENIANSTNKEPPSYGVVSFYIGCSVERIDSHGNAITALATLLIAAFSWILWVSANRQVELERAWVIVGIKNATVWYREPFYTLGVVLRATNSGRQPAWLTGHLIKLVKEPLPPTPDYTEERQYSRRPIAPSATRVLDYEERIDFTDAELAEIRKKSPLTVYGRLHYQDALGHHETRFRLCIFPNINVRDPFEPHDRVEYESMFDGPDAYNEYT